ncbi:MAG: hypothetical protein F4Z77_03365 [Dehalococcoidia bacterium]|nr:hypothetical protein [Dehalococcoidia bacterium]MYA51942.1 hypothetical protein [Dehalococcoidia bacterium]
MAGKGARATKLPTAEDMARYATCMEEVKRRIDVIEHFLSGNAHAVYLQTTVETICLQLRSVLELIALASLVANRGAYAEHRKNFRKDWQAKRILQDLEKVNPAFYPKPTKQVVDPVDGKVAETVDVRGGYLTRKEFGLLYDKLGEMVHAENPFSVARDYQAFLNELPGWVDKVRRLLNHHQIQLVNSDHQLWVLMESSHDGRPHVFLFERLSERLANVFKPEAEGELRAEDWRDALDEALVADEVVWKEFVDRANGPAFAWSPEDALEEDAFDISLAIRRTWPKFSRTGIAADRAPDWSEEPGDSEQDLWSRLDSDFPEWEKMLTEGLLPTLQGQRFVIRIKRDFPEALPLFIFSLSTA